MSLNNPIDTDRKIQHSILSFSNQATTAYRLFSKEDFLNMMSDMNLEDIKNDLEKFKALEEYEICNKIEFVIEQHLKFNLIEIVVSPVAAII
ncbi:MAG: hypothetical protein H7096_04200 [Flavobacterium sp.]|nr:hypothetical protein [Pedobacter sp.]